MSTPAEAAEGSISVQCASCGHTEAVPSSWAGREVTCPKCDKAVPVPVAVGAAAPLFAVMTRDERVNRRRVRRVGWPWFYHVLALFAHILIATGLGAAVWCYKQPPDAVTEVVQRLDPRFHEAARYAVPVGIGMIGLILGSAVLLVLDIAGHIRITVQRIK